MKNQAGRQAHILWMVLLAQGVCAQSTIDSVNRFCYGANIGWADWQADGANGVVVGEYVCSGYIYAANVGWINVGRGQAVDGIDYQNNSATDYGVNHDGVGSLRGLGWGANIGWVNFESLGAPRLDLATGKLSGFIYGANVGWISLSNAVAFVQTDTIRPGLDSDGDGIPDAFELTWTPGLSVMNGITDFDADGFSDANEYLADTDPTDSADNLRITKLISNPDNSQYTLTWTSKPSRFYEIQKRELLAPGSPWVDLSLGLIPPDPGPTTERMAADSPTTQRYFRVKALRPLSP